MAAGRPSTLEDEEKLPIIAEAIANGSTNKAVVKILAESGINTTTKTVGLWKKDERVKVRVQKIISDRAQQISRKVDTIIQRRLEDEESLSMRDLVMLRKEFGASDATKASVSNDALKDAYRAVQNNPDLIERMFKQIEETKTQKS